MVRRTIGKGWKSRRDDQNQIIRAHITAAIAKVATKYSQSIKGPPKTKKKFRGGETFRQKYADAIKKARAKGHAAGKRAWAAAKRR